MELRRLGRTNVHLSVVGFGTCQLRLVPEPQALATLAKGFELGVNWVHVSPDYGGAEELVARAITASGKRVIPVPDGSGAMPHFEHLFERSCRIFGRATLPVWGISCIDDQEFVGNDVWGPRGMVESLLAKKRTGRIQAAYCTTHGPPEYVERLITCGAFDAVMLAWNPLGFHVLSSYAAAEGKAYEDVRVNGERIFALAREHAVSVLVMKSLGGGLLGASRAFPPRPLLAPERAAIRARDVLRHALSQPGVTAVVPGASSVSEAEEDALAGHSPVAPEPEVECELALRVTSLRAALCSRCGACESTCSRGLPISWLFRDAYMWTNPADTFDAVPRLSYFHLHPEAALACATCTAPTCACPAGLDVPERLSDAHAAMLALRERGFLPATPAELELPPLGDDPRVRVVQAEVPEDGAGTCRLWLENAGDRDWAREVLDPLGVELRVRRGGAIVHRERLREDVVAGARVHLTFELPPGHERAEPRFFLARARGGETEIPVRASRPAESR